MSTYANSLAAYLSGEETHAGLARLIGKKQVSVTRYANGQRFPDADTARMIEAATDGRVPFVVWRSEFEQRSGLAA